MIHEFITGVQGKAHEIRNYWKRGERLYEKMAKDMAELTGQKLPKLKKDGTILVDNVIWSGKVVEPIDPGDHSTRGILDFNKHVSKDSRVEQVMMAVEDGIMLIRKL